MSRSLSALIIAVVAITTTQSAAEPESGRDAHVRRYVSTMHTCLHEVGIVIKRVDMRNDEVFVAYKVATDGPTPRYALAAVLMTVAPIAGDATMVRARDVTDGRRLLTLSVKPSQLSAVPAWIVDDHECAELESLLAEIEAACAAAQTEDR